MSYATIPDFSAGELTSAELNVVVDAINALFPVGFYAYICKAATTTETLVNGVWLECNGTSVLRATYPDLNTLLSSLSYPFGSVDGTHMTLPDAVGRAPVSMASGGHADVNALGAADPITLANKNQRTPHHNTLAASAGTPAGSISGAPDKGTLALASGVVTATGGAGTVPAGSGQGVNTVAITGAPGVGSLGFSGSSMATHAHGPGGTRSVDTVPYLVAGCLFIKAKA